MSMRLTPKPLPSPTPLGADAPPAEDEATRVREIKASARRLGASTNLSVAAITCGISSSMAKIMFEAARTAKGAPGTFADIDSRSRWDSDPALRGEFGSFERFAAWAQAQAAGRVKTAKSVVIH